MTRMTMTRMMSGVAGGGKMIMKRGLPPTRRRLGVWIRCELDGGKGDDSVQSDL